MNRSQRSILSVVLAALIGLFAVSATAPAIAQTPGGIIKHVADEGYAPPIYIRCAGGSQHALGVGVGSRSLCQNATAFYVAGPSQRLKCNYYSNDAYIGTSVFEFNGWFEIASLTRFDCWWLG